MKRSPLTIWPALLLALSLVLAACGGGENGADGAGEGDGAQAAADEGEPSGDLTVWHYYDEGAGGLFDKLSVWEERFESEYPDVNVDFQYVPYGDMASRVTASAAAGQGPDVILLALPFLYEMIQSGAVEPIDEYWDDYADADQYPEDIADAYVVDGQRYAVQAFANVVGVYYNEELLDELGLEVPESMQEFEEAMAAADEAGHNALTTSATPGAGGEFWVAQWLASEGWSYEDAENEGAREALNRLADWREQGYVSADDATGFNAGANFTSGRYLFAQEGNWFLGQFEEELDFPYGVAYFDGVDRAAIGGEAMSVGAFSDNPGTAWRFIEEVLLSQEGQTDAIDAGSVPLRSDMLEDPTLAEDELLQTFAQIAAESIATPVSSTSGQISDVVGGAYNELIVGNISGDEAFERIADRVPQLMDEGQAAE